MYKREILLPVTSPQISPRAPRFLHNAVNDCRRRIEPRGISGRVPQVVSERSCHANAVLCFQYSSCRVARVVRAGFADASGAATRVADARRRVAESGKAVCPQFTAASQAVRTDERTGTRLASRCKQISSRKIDVSLHERAWAYSPLSFSSVARVETNVRFA